MKYDSKTDWRRLLGISTRVILSLVLVGLLVIPVVVQADLKVTNAAYAWDGVADKFQNSNVVIPWGDGTWIPFLHRLNFDGDMWPEATLDCPAGTTEWAGVFYYGLYHEDTGGDADPDNPPEGPAGWQESQLWSLIDCDRDPDDKWLPGDLSDVMSPYERGTVYADCLPSDQGGTYCVVEENEQDQPVWCGLGNCSWEIVTTVRVNLDLDCDHAIDQPLLDLGLSPDLVCFYAQARVPTADKVDEWGMWTIPLQARISSGLIETAGDKTVSFSFYDPTAVELASFDAAPQENGVLLTWETANELDNMGFNIYRADSQVGQLNKINPHLIASQDPGSTVGAAYSFLDESAVPGATYYYWLEDVDVSGAVNMNGPVAVQMGAARALPGRPRPAPLPDNAF